MKPIDSQDYYEILEVSADAGPEELDRAYRIALSAYGSGSLASYSVFDEADADLIRERIELAHHVLSDPEQRRAYDESIGKEGIPEDRGVEEALRSGTPLQGHGESAAAADRFVDIEAETEEEEEAFDGPRLRRARLRRGIELQEIATITKVRSTYLECIEEDRFDDLPARVYVRGFVDAYARAVGLDAARVTDTYMAHFDIAGQEPRRGRLLGRR